MKTLLSFLNRIYAYLVRYYPHSYQEEFAEEMLLDFSALAADANKKGIFSLILFCLRELIEFPANLLRIHVREGRMFKILHSQPVNNGLRGALGFGIAFTLTVPLSTFVYENLSFWLNDIASRLQTFFYNLFHLQQASDLLSWIPTALNSLLTDLLFGVLLAALFADRSKYPRYILVGLLGWFLHHTVGYIFSVFNFWGFLTETQFWCFDYMLLAFSGAIFGLIFVVVKSERRLALPWLAMGAIIYPVFAYLLAKQLFHLFIFGTPWRFVGVTILMLILVASVFVVAIKLDNKRRLPWVVVTGTIAYPTVRLLMLAVDKFIYPSLISADLTLVNITVTNGIYGILFGLLLGLGLGSQKENNLPQLTT